MNKLEIKRILRKALRFVKATLRKLELIASSSVYAVILTVLLALVGILGGVWNNELQNSWPFVDSQNNDKQDSEIQATGEAKLIYILFIVFVFLFLGREIAVENRANRKEKEFYLKVRTLPDEDVMEVFAAGYTAIEEYIETEVEGQGVTNCEQIKESLNCKEKAIQQGLVLCLNTLIALARQFERTPKHYRYASNIMRYIAISEIAETDKQEIIEQLKDFRNCKTLNGLKGVLYLSKSLSGSTDSNNPFSTDKGLKNDIVMPVPEIEYSIHNGKQRFLPGAPAALEIKKGLYSIDDTFKLLNSYDSTDNFQELPRSVFVKGNHYFRKTAQGKLVRSFLSIRIMESGKSGAKKLGVLNIHSDKPNIFKDDWRVQAYISLITPIMSKVRYLLLKGNEAEQASQE